MRPITRIGLCLPVVASLALTGSTGASAAAPPDPAAAPAAAAVGHAPLRPALKESLGRTVRNDLLRDTLAEEGDEDDVDGSGRSAAPCQTYNGTTTNPYSALAPEVDLISADRRTRAGSGRGCFTAQNETSVAVNPENPMNLVAGANDYRVFNDREGRNDGSGWAYTSMDGGKTWKDVQLPGLTYQTRADDPLSIMDSAGDPAISFGPHNRVYYANIVFSRLSTANGITVNVSDDGGLTWGPPRIVRLDGVAADGTARPTRYFNDKVWVAGDPRSDRVYVTWTRFTFTDAGQETYVASPIVVSRSDDGGRSFGGVLPVGPGAGQLQGHVTPYSQGSMPQVGRDGALYVAYEGTVCRTLACDAPGDHDATVVATSRDRGRSFTLAQVGPNYDFPGNPDVGRATLSGEVFRINSFPSLTYDATNDQLAVAWADDRNGLYDDSGRSVQTDGDIFLSTSRGGARWSPLQRIGTQQDEVFPAVGAGAGKLAVSFYTRLYDPWDPSGRRGPSAFGVGLDYALAQVGQTGFTRLTSQTSDPRVQFTAVGAVSHNLLSGVFIGDYTQMAVGTNGVAHPVWTDFRGQPGVTSPNQDAVSRAVPLR